MNEPTIKDVGTLQFKAKRNCIYVVVITLTLGLTASLVASPTVKEDLAAGNGTTSSGKTLAKHHWFQIGKASWYGGTFNGRKTANGETYDMYDLTCAHRTLPLGSWIRVTNLRNRRSALLRVNDRGPMVANRIVDLSYAAARRLGISGLANVRIETVNPSDQRMAEQTVAQLDLNDPAKIQPAAEQPSSVLEPGMLAALEH